VFEKHHRFLGKKQFFLESSEDVGRAAPEPVAGSVLDGISVIWRRPPSMPAARMTSAHFAMSASRLKRIPGRGGGEFQISNVGAET